MKRHEETSLPGGTPVRVQPVVGTPRPITKERWQQICRGRVTVREITRYHPRLKSFTTRYAPKVSGVLLKTGRGLKFKTSAQAIEAGRECLKAMRLRECPNAALCDGTVENLKR